MIDGVQLKVCGITSLVDADLADRCGADYLGIIFYPASPRYVSPAHYAAMAERLPPRRRVAVFVEPSAEQLAAADAAGFDRFQIHFRVEAGESGARAWSDAVGSDRLWLAPKLAPGTALPEALLPLAKTFLLDGYRADRFGGTGVTTNWANFGRLRREHPGHRWVLSGGLNAENIGAALSATGATFVDVNSGVESAPGVKDLETLKAFVVSIHRAKTSVST